jgi:hypothetical protein
LHIVPPAHPKGARARVLLTSVFGPYARDDESGSRAMHPMELHYNQATQAHGAFSLHMFHLGPAADQAKLSAPCTVLDCAARRALRPDHLKTRSRSGENRLRPLTVRQTCKRRLRQVVACLTDAVSLPRRQPAAGSPAFPRRGDRLNC